MAKRSRGPQGPRGRVQPIRAQGVALLGEPIGSPLRHIRHYDENEYGQNVEVSRRTSATNNKFLSTLILVKGGNIQLEQVNPEFQTTAAQRRHVRYLPGDVVSFTDQRQYLEDADWAGFDEPGKLLVVEGVLERVPTPGTGSKFNFSPQVWDIAASERHEQGALAVAAAYLEV